MEVIPYLADGRETQAVRAVVLHRLRDIHIGVVHDIEDDDQGAPMLGPGKLLSTEAARDMAALLTQGQKATRALLPECVLAADPDMLVWWRPAVRRPIIFDAASPALNKLSGHPVCHPPLLFVGRPRRLAVYALTDDKRPDGQTALCRAPYYNLYATGSMCEGNTPLPPTPVATQAVIDMYETAFYDSAFVHTNMGGGQLVRWPGAHAGFWEAMTQCSPPHFPARALVPLRTQGGPLTVQHVLTFSADSLMVDVDAPETAERARR